LVAMYDVPSKYTERFTPPTPYNALRYQLARYNTRVLKGDRELST
jgi:hypothetical protein